MRQIERDLCCEGEGELKDLELNDELLTDLLELPVWLRLSKATCNRVAVRIAWTKLKSVPIHLSLDEVRVEVETCEDLRSARCVLSSLLGIGPVTEAMKHHTPRARAPAQ